MALPPGTPEPLRKIVEDALVKTRDDPEFKKEWERVVLEGNAFEQMFTGKEVLDDVKVYTDWRPELIGMYKRLAPLQKSVGANSGTIATGRTSLGRSRAAALRPPILSF